MLTNPTESFDFSGEQMITSWMRVAAAVALPLLLPGCPSKDASKGAGAGSGQPKKDKDRELVVASVGTTRFTVGSLTDELNKQNPYVRMRFTSIDRRKEFLKNMIRFEVLASEARKQGLHRDPEVIRRVKRVMIDRLMEKMHASLVKIEDITDKDVESYYQAQRQLYHQPPKARASWIVTATEAEARTVLAEAKKKPTDMKHFAVLAAQHNLDPETKARRGDLDFFDKDTKKVPQAVVEAVFAVKGNWQLVGPVQLPADGKVKGWAVAMKTGEIEAIDRPLAMEKDRIKNRLYNERRMKALEQYVDGLQKKSKIEINDGNLARVKIDMSIEPGKPAFHGHGRGQ
jgi:peptidyl-prolyl cis-trans isomerase C